jgi:rRNA-processing protein FCF1
MALPSKTKIIALDTNMLMAIEQFKVDVFRQAKEMEGRVKFVVPVQVDQELKKLSKKSKTLAKRVRIAQELMKKHAVKRKRIAARNADQALIKLAREGVIVATNDKELKKEVKKAKGSIMFLRKKKLIERE